MGGFGEEIRDVIKEEEGGEGRVNQEGAREMF